MIKEAGGEEASDGRDVGFRRRKERCRTNHLGLEGQEAATEQTTSGGVALLE
jgi:hypothetical protein